jgi:hypothetical protein
MRVQPAVPQPPAPPTPISAADLARTSNSPAEVLKAAKAARSELRNQLDRLQDQQRDITNQLSDEGTPAAARTGLEARLKDIDARIAATDAQIAQADANVVKATAVPGSIVPEPEPPRNNDEALVAIPVVFTLFVLAPIAVAYARRIWKRGSQVAAPISREVTDRLDQLSQSVESIALEVERIGEGQRFVTKVMTESNRALGAGAAQPIQVGQGERAAVPRQG